MTLDTALYIGEAGNKLADGTPLIPGVTIANVPDDEAESSDLWSAIDPTEPTDSAPASVLDGGTVSPIALATLDGGTP
jgi:hypothetical protein